MNRKLSPLPMWSTASQSLLIACFVATIHASFVVSSSNSAPLLRLRYLQGNDEDVDATSSNAVEAGNVSSSSIDGDEGKWAVFCFLVFTGWVLLAFSTAVWVYAIKENELMQKYEAEGVSAAGDIVRIELLRGGVDTPSPTGSNREPTREPKVAQDSIVTGCAPIKMNHNMHRKETNNLASSLNEYLVAVHYDTKLAPEYTTRISKWIRVRGDDLPRLLVQKYALIGSVVEKKTRAELEKIAEEDAFKEHKICTPSSRRRAETEAHGINMDLLVIPGFPCSGYPRAAVSRARSLRSRFVSLVYVFFGAIFGAALLYFAAYSICDGTNIALCVTGLNGSSSRGVFLVVECASMGLVSLLLWSEVNFLDVPITNLLANEFLKEGEYVSREPTLESEDPLDLICRTMSSRSDIYLLATTKQAAFML